MITESVTEILELAQDRQARRDRKRAMSAAVIVSVRRFIQREMTEDNQALAA